MERFEFKSVEEQAEFVRTTLSEELKKHAVNVTFKKGDGTLRTMQCTLRPDLLPIREETEKTSTRAKDPNRIVAYDLEKEAWRSFKTERVISWMISEGK